MAKCSRKGNSVWQGCRKGCACLGNRTEAPWKGVSSAMMQHLEEEGL